MNTARTVRMLLTAALFVAPAMALAQDAITAPAVKTIGVPKSAMVPSLAVINSRGASLQENVLTLTGVAPNSIVFADRPVRAAGHVLTSDFFKGWDSSFGKDPPNATVSVLSADGASVKDAVVVLKTPKLEGDKLTFEVSVLEGDLSKADGPAALFIDWFAARGFGGRAFVGGAGFRGAGWHGAWYGHPGAALATGAVVGGAIGAAAAGAYGAYDPYYSSCGVYPYPPC
jgi:hypothetical protein